MLRVNAYYKLGDVSEKIGSGSTPKGGQSVYIEDGVSLIRSQNVYNMEFSYNGLAHIDDNAAKILKNVVLKEEDILLNITGDSVARCCIVPKDVLPARVNQHVSIVRVDTSLINPKFLMYYLASPFMQKYLIMLAQGKGASRSALTKEMISKLDIPKIDLNCQAIITNSLEKYDLLIENNKKRIKILEQMADEIYKEWFVKMRFPNFEKYNFKSENPKGWILGNHNEMFIPEDWKFGKVIDIGTFVRGKNITKGEMIEGEIPVISAGIEPSGYHNESNVKGYSLTMSASGANAGYLNYHLNDIWAADCSYYNNDSNIWFMYNSLNFIRKAIDNLQVGSAQPHVYPKNINKLSILIPEEKYILKFNELVKPFYEEIKVLKSKNGNLAKQRDLLLPRLMSGKLEVKESE